MNTEKTIVAISSSPSKGRNSDSMLDAFIKGVKEQEPNVNIEKIYLIDLNIDHYCFENSTGFSEHEKEFASLANKIKNADGLIISTPTYNFSVPACLKNLIDRLRFVALDMTKRNILGQPTGQLNKLNLFFLVSGGTPKWQQRFIFFIYPAFWLRIVFAYYGSRKIKSYYSGNTKTFENKNILNKCQKLGKKFIKSIK